MRVKILDQEWELANAPSSIGELFSKIEEKLDGTGYIFSSLTVDGVEIETDFDLYLSPRITEIQEIQVGVKSLRCLMQETLQSAVDYLERAQPEVEKLSTEFYQGPTDETWAKVSQFLEGLQWLLEAGTVIDSLQPRNPSADSRWEREFREKIKLLEEAMENNDYVLLGDLLQYEITPLFSSLNREIRELLRTGESGSATLN